MSASNTEETSPFLGKQEVVPRDESFDEYQLKDFIKSKTLCDVFSESIPTQNFIINLHETFLSKTPIGGDLRNYENMGKKFLPRFLNILAESDFNLSLGRLIDILNDLDRKLGTKGIYKSFEKNSEKIRNEIKDAIKSRQIQNNTQLVTTFNQGKNSAHLDLDFKVRIPVGAVATKTINIVYHTDQLNENNRKQFEIFVKQLNLKFNDLNLQFEKFDLAEHSPDDLKPYIDENKPLILIYDLQLHERILDLDFRIDANSSDKDTKLRRFYHLLYDRYCRNGCKNNSFFPFSLDDFDKYLKENGPNNSKNFKYRWLLQYVDETQTSAARFKQIPVDSKQTSIDKLEQDLTDFKKNFGKKLGLA